MENRIMDMALHERPQERLLRYGAESLSNSELLAVILRVGTKEENIIQLSQKIITVFNGINGLLEASQEELMKILILISPDLLIFSRFLLIKKP